MPANSKLQALRKEPGEGEKKKTNHRKIYGTPVKFSSMRDISRLGKTTINTSNIATEGNHTGLKADVFLTR